MLEEDAADEVLCGEEEAAVEMTVAEEEKDGGEQDGEGEDAEQSGGEPSPDGEGEALPGEAFAAEFGDGGEGVDRAEGGCDREECDAGQPEIHAGALTGAGERSGGEGRVGGPAADGCAARDEEGGEERDEGERGEPQAGGVDARKGHVVRADLCGEDQVAEAGLGCDGEDEEEHQRAVHGDEGEVLFGKDGAVEG